MRFQYSRTAPPRSSIATYTRVSHTVMRPPLDELPISYSTLVAVSVDALGASGKIPDVEPVL
jgi:hypothetical protein